MEMEMICRETIKPSSPTSSNLTIYPLSLFDNSVAPNAVPLIYFYHNETTEEEEEEAAYDVCDQTSTQKISMLKKSLSEVLSIYYPFAGRINNDHHCIECKDQGVSFLVTRIKIRLSQILLNPTENLLNPLFPDESQWKELGSGYLVAIQINCFACGGIAVSVCMSHKVGDASTLFNFINDWSTFNRKNRAQEQTELIITLPLFDAGSTLFPQGDFPISPPFAFLGDNNNVISRRLVFEGSQIETLKSMVSSQNVQNPTRVEVVVAMIYKCAVSASRLDANYAVLRVAINLRKRMVPPLPEKSIGNLVSSFYASSMDESGFELHEIVSKTREGLSQFCGKYLKNFGDLEFISKFLLGSGKTTKCLSKKKKSMFFFASWCRFSMYEADFGWGKPKWVTVSGCPMRNTIVLMDRRDGKGIEAVVSMEDKDMAIFERDLELLRYASLQPNRWT